MASFPSDVMKVTSKAATEIGALTDLLTLAAEGLAVQLEPRDATPCA